MKKMLASLFAIYFLLPAINGQTSVNTRPSSIGISFFLNDFTTPQRIRSSSLARVFREKQIAKLNDMSPGIAISYFKGLKDKIDFAATLGGSFVNYPFPNRPPFAGDNLLLEADASVNLKLTGEKYWFQPFLSAGVGAHKYKVYYGAFIPVGIGFKVNFFDEASLFFNSQYRIPVTVETGNYHFYNSIGVAGIIGKKREEPVKVVEIPQAPKDSDGDGITDDLDKCPQVPGVAKYEGCPIPDTDKDGVNDEIDKCPTVPGLARYEGCPVPDTDKDGINDEEDKCKDTPGVARYQGCPVPDKDSDGVNDEEDKCPDVPGTIANQGCPDIKEEITKKVNYAAQNILFITGSFKLAAKSNKGLDEVVKILQNDQDLKISIEGHTDHVGDAAKNQTLSENRANAVKQYFVRKGIDESRITANGFGEDQPISDNNTAAGRAKNRRVEMKLSY